MTTLYLVRHGETVENAAHILQGHLPGQLSATGIRQAGALAAQLASRHFDALLCSDLKRCLDTAVLLNRPHGLPLQTTPLLRERDWGSFTGKPIAEVQGVPFPPDVESLEAMLARATQVLADIARLHPGQTVLVVSHGLFCRAIQAVHYHKELRDIRRMDNAECRVLHVQ